MIEPALDDMQTDEDKIRNTNGTFFCIFRDLVGANGQQGEQHTNALVNVYVWLRVSVSEQSSLSLFPLCFWQAAPRRCD